MTPLSQRTYSPQKPDPFWRASRICARLHLKQHWSERDRRIARFLSQDEGVTNRLIDQALSGLQARSRHGR